MQSYGGWFAGRELRGGFQLVGRLCAPRSRENSAGKIISLPLIPRLNFVPLCTAARLKTTPRERSSAIVSMDSYHSPSSRTSTSLPLLPFFSPPFSVFAIHSQIYPYSCRLLRLIIKFPFWRTSFAAPLFRYPFRSTAFSLSHSRTSRSIIIRVQGSHPSHLHSHLRIRDRSHSHPPPRFSHFFQFLRFILHAFCSYFSIFFFTLSHDSRFMKVGDMG